MFAGLDVLAVEEEVYNNSDQEDEYRANSQEQDHFLYIVCQARDYSNSIPEQYSNSGQNGRLI